MKLDTENFVRKLLKREKQQTPTEAFEGAAYSLFDLDIRDKKLVFTATAPKKERFSDWQYFFPDTNVFSKGTSLYDLPRALTEIHLKHTGRIDLVNGGFISFGTGKVHVETKSWDYATFTYYQLEKDGSNQSLTFQSVNHRYVLTWFDTKAGQTRKEHKFEGRVDDYFSINDMPAVFKELMNKLANHEKPSLQHQLFGPLMNALYDQVKYPQTVRMQHAIRDSNKTRIP